jgi:hypothetical protein
LSNRFFGILIYQAHRLAQPVEVLIQDGWQVPVKSVLKGSAPVGDLSIFSTK